MIQRGDEFLVVQSDYKTNTLFYVSRSDKLELTDSAMDNCCIVCQESRASFFMCFRQMIQFTGYY